MMMATMGSGDIATFNAVSAAEETLHVMKNTRNCDLWAALQQAVAHAQPLGALAHRMPRKRLYFSHSL